MHSYGLKWTKVDFHVHTPGSTDFKGSATAADIVSRAIALGLDAIAVTDHNTGAWIDQIKDAAKGSGLTVFPGVEITVMGGKPNTHIVALFDTTRGTTYVHDLLARLNLTEDTRGRTDSLASGDVNQVIDEISAMGGIPIMAHADSNSGVLGMKGQARISIVQNPRLLGAEVSKLDTIKFLNGTDPEYQRSMACYQSSDSHALSEMGSRHTWMKMGAMTLSAVKQCLTDPETRIRLGAIDEKVFPKIESMAVSGGFCNGMEVIWHEGLNTLLGGKGVGKSLLVEFTRFVLNQPSDVKAVRDDMNLKLQKQLGVNGEVKIKVRMANGSEYEVTRWFNGGSNPSEARDLSTGSVQPIDIAKVFPIMAYSQSEVIDIARDENIQLLLIDRLLDLASIDREIEKASAILKENTSVFVSSHFAAQRVGELDDLIATEAARIKDVDAALSDPKFNEKKEWDKQESQIAAIDEEAKGIVETLTEALAEVSLPSLPEDTKMPAGQAGDYLQAVADGTKRLRERFTLAVKTYEQDLAKAASIREAWKANQTKWEAEFETFLEKVGGQHKALTKSRAAIQVHLDNLTKEREKKKVEAAQLAEHRKRREQFLDNLRDWVNARFEVRAKKYEELTKKSGGRLRLTVVKGGGRRAFQGALSELYRGMHISGQTYKNLAQNLEPRAFVDAVLNADDAALRTAGASESALPKILSAPETDEALAELLAMAYGNVPVDLPSIEYQKEDGNYYPLAELSVGQKCTALITIALSEGAMPIIIDQPEDALDVATVYLDVVTPLRKGKDARQFIITTHNPNVAVSSDSDKFHVLRGTATSGEIVCAGAIDLDHVAKEVLDHLEGGAKAYAVRGRKYNISG